MSVILATSEYAYTCGCPLIPSKFNPCKTVMCRAIICSFPVDYSRGLGRNGICSLCSNDNAEDDSELKKKYKTVLPLCNICKYQGQKSVVARPFQYVHLIQSFEIVWNPF